MMAAVAETVERFGGLDVAVANAGIAQSKVTTTRAMPTEEWERVFEVDLMGVWRTVRAALPQIVERKGQLVLIASVYAFMQRDREQPLRGRQGRGRVDGPDAAHELTPFGRERDRRLLRLDRHRDGPGRDRRRRAGSRSRNSSRSGSSSGLTAGRRRRRRSRRIEERAPRVFVPHWWRYVSALRGLIIPLLDSRTERDERMAAGDPTRRGGNGDRRGRSAAPR